MDNQKEKPAERVIDKPDGDPNTQNLVRQLRVNTDNNPNTVEWADKNDIINTVKNTGLGDAMSLNVADRYAGATYGVQGFARTSDAEHDNNNDALLKNQHNEIIAGPAYKKSVQVLKEQWGAEDDMWLVAPSNYKNNATKLRTARMLKAYALENSKTFNQEGSNKSENIEQKIAETMSKIESMTNDELYQYMTTDAYPVNNQTFDNWWGKQ